MSWPGSEVFNLRDCAEEVMILLSLSKTMNFSTIMFSYVVMAVKCICICTFHDTEHFGVLRLEFKTLIQNT